MPGEAMGKHECEDLCHTPGHFTITTVRVAILRVPLVGLATCCELDHQPSESTLVLTLGCLRTGGSGLVVARISSHTHVLYLPEN